MSSLKNTFKVALQLGVLLIAGSACSAGTQPPGVDCSAHPTCGVDTGGCTEGKECISIPGCGSAICIASSQACGETCTQGQCAILESYPAQIACTEGKPVPGRNGSGGAAGSGGSVGSGGAAGGGGTTGQACEALDRAYAAELATVQACSTDADCGQPILGTSCGCTRNLVAREDADLSKVQALLSEMQSNGCGGLVSTCDCPAADGFLCNQGRCAWNYIRQ